MRTLIVTPDYPPTLGGIQRLLHSMALNLAPMEIKVVTVRRSTAEPDEVDGIPVIRLRTYGRSAWMKSLSFNAAVAALRIKAWKPDVILNGHVTTIAGALVLKARFRRPVITYAYGKEVLGRPGLTRLAAKRSAAVVAISEYTAGLVKNACNGRMDQSQLHVINPGTIAPPLPGRADAARPTVVTVSRLRDYYKGHDKLMHALLEVLPDFPDLEWIVIGDGPIRRQLEDETTSLGLTRNVRFLGEVTDDVLHQVFSKAHVFCMPARYPKGEVAGEGFAIVYAEAGGWGIPCIAGNVGGPSEAVKADVSGLLVDPESVSDIAHALHFLLSNPAEARRLGEGGRERAQTELAWSTVARQLETVLRACATESR